MRTDEQKYIQSVIDKSYDDLKSITSKYRLSHDDLDKCHEIQNHIQLLRIKQECC